ncbi:hypothetical protein ACHHYP_20493 [Achlya hypogyna]|uniref:HTH CENPB-type domain-containing protein n=1 Tax=Achlya hypogyna TaxID=1202772 RepID=A0A1V9YKS0_ACHHY|nr:hypothetical protein ACHHYP_20493 [Achlya hypogyna]
MLHNINDILAAVNRHLVDGTSMAAVARSSPLSQTTIKYYAKMKKDTADIEDDLVSWAAAMHRAGWPVDQHDMIEKANQVLELVPQSARSNLGRGW